jgi:hypothetical protein
MNQNTFITVKLKVIAYVLIERKLRSLLLLKKKFVGTNLNSWERILFRGNEFNFVGTNLNSWERI